MRSWWAGWWPTSMIPSSPCGKKRPTNWRSSATPSSPCWPRSWRRQARQRLEKIIGRLQALTPEGLREIRAVEALEWMATAEASRLLHALSQGAAGVRLTSEAAEARQRLGKKKMQGD